MERMLYNAAVNGDVNMLLRLLQEDRLILNRYMVGGLKENPLHVSVMLGHVEFSKEVVRLEPKLAEELNLERSTPLHLASAKGNSEIVKELLLASPDMCLASDRDGLNPLHIAIIRGRVSVIRELIQARPDAARVQVNRSDSIMHLCIRHSQFDVLKELVEILGPHDELMNSKDEYGNTILHLAVIDKTIEIITNLVTSTTVKVNELNLNGLTALDILAQSRRDVNIGESLRSVGALRGREIHSLTHEIVPPEQYGLSRHQITRNKSNPNPQSTVFAAYRKRQNNWIEKTRSALMVVASLIATMAFQVGVNPPGGVWQDDQGHIAGLPIMVTTNISSYNILLASNSLGFVGSFSIILLLISGLPIASKWFMWILVIIMWITISSMAVTYAISISAFDNYQIKISPFNKVNLGNDFAPWILGAWVLLIGFILVLHLIRLIVKTTKWFWRLTMPKAKRTSITAAANIDHVIV